MTTSAPRQPGPKPPPPAAAAIRPSAVTAPVPPAGPPGPVLWARLAWVTWRQQRATLAGVGAALGAFGVYLLIMGLEINNAYARVAGCHPAGSAACRQLADAFNRAYWGGGGGPAVRSGGAQAVASLLLAVPVVLGIFAGTPLISRELETGTFRFAWTQGCGRLRWAVSKLVLLATVVTAAAWAFSELFSWYFHPFIADGQVSSLLPMAFGLLGVVFAAWTLAAFAIGVFAGAVIRRTVPAMAAALVTTAALAIATVISLRPHYEAPLTSTGASPPAGNSAWVVGQWIAGPDGKPASQATIQAVIGRAPVRVQNSLDPNAANAWLTQHHYLQSWAYQPQSRFWHFQLIEGGWLLVLSLVLMAATVWLVRRRAA